MRNSLLLLLCLLCLTTVKGQRGHCLFLASDTALLEIPHAASLEMSNFGRMSVEIWVLADTLTVYPASLAQKAGSWELGLDSLRRPFFHTFGMQNGSAIGQPVNPGRWVHLAGIFTGTETRLYVDGFLVAAVPALGLQNAVNIPVCIGKGFTGFVDALRLWRKVLGIDELRHHIYHELPDPGAMPHLSCVLQFNEDSSRFCFDRSGMGNDAEIQGMDSIMARVPGTAPLPYYTVQPGSLFHDSVWHPSQDRPSREWARVHLQHPFSLNELWHIKACFIGDSGILAVETGGKLWVSDTMANAAAYNGLILRSDSSGQAEVVQPSKGVKATILRYLPEDTWHHFSTPVKAALTGVFTGMWLLPFDEPGGGWGNYIGQTGMILQPAKGYAAWSSSAYTGNHTIFLFGELNQGDIPAPSLSRQGPDPHYAGFNFIGNPYPATIHWDNMNGLDRYGLDDAVYVYDANQRNYQTWVNGRGINRADPRIGPMQGFFVRVSENNLSGSIRFWPEAVSPPLATPDRNAPSLRMRVERSAAPYFDESLLTFDANHQAAFDPHQDAAKLLGNQAEVPQLYSLTNDSGSIRLAIQNLGRFLDPVQIPLCFIPGEDSSFVLRFQKDRLNANTSIVLEDKFMQAFTNLSSDSVYAFAADSADSAYRFLLHIDPVGFSGRIHYHNPVASAIPGSLLWMKLGSTNDSLIMETTSAGDFVFPFADTGVYHLNAKVGEVNQGGAVNAVDALRLMRYLHGLDSLDSLQIAAADMNEDGQIDSTDVQSILYHFSELLPGSSEAGWILENLDVHVQYQDIQAIKLRGIIRGDVTRSWVPIDP